MGIEQIAAAMDRVTAVLQRKPQVAVSDDAPATAHWAGDLRTLVQHAAGHTVATDMPAELGGEARDVTPGWLLRAALASCAVTRIAMAAAAAGVALDVLEVRATSRSDARGLLGMPDPEGHALPAGPLSMDLHVRIGAAGVAADRLRALVASTAGCSPVTCAVEQALPVGLHVDVAG
jgi:uncharacterized OsmC-like protein